MSGVRETHRMITVVQGDGGTSVSCDCGWSHHSVASWGLSSPLGRRIRLQTADISWARKLWRDHVCVGVAL